MRTWLITLTLFVSAVVAPCLVQAEAPMSVRVYSVADLVVRPGQIGTRNPMQSALLGQVQIAAQAVAQAVAKPDPQEELARQNLSQLVNVIETITVPTDWEAAGGLGRVAAYPETFSLVVRQSEVGHQEVSDLLRQLRADNEVKVKLSVHYFSPHQRHSAPVESDQPTWGQPAAPPDVDSTIARLTAEFGSSFDTQQLAAARKQIEQVAGLEISHTTELQHARAVSLGLFTYTAIVSQDRRFVDVNIDASWNEYGVMSYPVRLPAGHSKVLQMPILEDEGFLALVTASIDIPEEEEQLLNLDLAPVDRTEFTPRRNRHEPLELKTYSVTDLVIQPQSQVEATTSRQDWTDRPVDASKEMERLVSFLRQTTPDDLWKNGTSITPHFNTHQLVVRQTPSGHHEIEQLLSMLREPENVEVRFQLVPIAFGERTSNLIDKIDSIVNLQPFVNSIIASNPLSPDQAGRIAECLPPEFRASTLELVIPNGRRRVEAMTQCLRMTPIVSPDRRQAKVFVDSFVDEHGQDELVISRHAFEVQDGRSILLHTYNDGTQRLWLITVHISDRQGRAAETAKMPRREESARDTQ